MFWFKKVFVKTSKKAKMTKILPKGKKVFIFSFVGFKLVNIIYFSLIAIFLLYQFINTEMDKLKDRYVSIVIEIISIALPVCIRAVPAKTNTKSGYAIAAAKDEFFVKFKYWLVVGGIIILNAWGITTSLRI